MSEQPFDVVKMSLNLAVMSEQTDAPPEVVSGLVLISEHSFDTTEKYNMKEKIRLSFARKLQL